MYHLIRVPRAALVTTIALAVVGAHAARTITIRNECTQSLWPVILSTSAEQVGGLTGWEAVAGSSLALQVPDTWTGRIWARTKCDFDKKLAEGELACQTGGCVEGLICESNFSGAPASLVEIHVSDQQDIYDVSLVDGYNVNVRISPNVEASGGQCAPAECVSNILETCPPEIRLTVDNVVVGCTSSCYAQLDANPANSSNCCSGSFSTPDMCTSSGVKYYTYFDDACPGAYASAFDDVKATRMCSGKPSYAISFCPGDGGTHSQTIDPSASGSATGSASESVSESSLRTGSDAAASGTTSSTPTQTSIELGDDGTPVAAIAGGVVAGVVVLALLALAFLLWRRKRKSADHTHASPYNAGKGGSGAGAHDDAEVVSPYTTHLQPGSGARGAAGVGFGGAATGAYGSSADPILGIRTADGNDAPVMVQSAGGKRALIREWSGNQPDSGAAVGPNPSWPSGPNGPVTGSGSKLSVRPAQTNRADGTGTTYFPDESSPGGTVPLSAFALGHPSLSPVAESDSRVQTHGGSSGTRNNSGPESLTSPTSGSASYETWSAGGGGSSIMIIGPMTASDRDAAASSEGSRSMTADASTRAVIRERASSQRRGGPASAATANPHKDFPPPAYSSIQYNGQANG